jgi:hypothetical protein
MKLRAVLVALAVVSLSACQSHRTAMEIICNAPSDCLDCSAADPATRVSHLATYISTHVTNPEAVDMFSSMAAMDPAERGPILRAAAAREGLTSCPWADELSAHP